MNDKYLRVLNLSGASNLLAGINSSLQDVLRRSTDASESSGIDVRILPRELQVGREGDESRCVWDCGLDSRVPVRVKEGFHRP